MRKNLYLWMFLEQTDDYAVCPTVILCRATSIDEARSLLAKQEVDQDILSALHDRDPHSVIPLPDGVEYAVITSDCAVLG